MNLQMPPHYRGFSERRKSRDELPRFHWKGSWKEQRLESWEKVPIRDLTPGWLPRHRKLRKFRRLPDNCHSHKKIVSLLAEEHILSEVLGQQGQGLVHLRFMRSSLDG